MTTRSLGAPGRAGFRRFVGATASGIAILAPAAARAQLIAVKTAPVAESPQFAVLPSPNLGLGGASIALADSTLDPFLNPAKAARLRGTRLFGAPTFYSLSRKAGGGLTLPLGMFASSGPWFSALALAAQEVDAGPPNDFGGVFLAADASVRPAPVASTASDDEPSRRNGHLFAMLGRRFAAPGVAVAASVSWWRLHAVDGVESFYPLSQRVRQRGDELDVRLGLVREWGHGQTLEAVAVHNRYGVDQDVSISEVFWDPDQRTIVPVARVEPNADRSRTWGLHLAYTRPLADSTWRVGGILTANRIRQPRMPAYELPEVPADAGRAYAYDVGAGVARSDGRWTLGLDAIYEPVWNRTWVRADEATETRGGTPIEAGATRVESRFRFDNAILRAGVGRTFAFGSDGSFTLEAGGQLKAYRYRLDQWDALQQAASGSHQGWNEWTRTWGAGLRLAGVDLRYRGRLTTGAGRPGVDDRGIVVLDPLGGIPIDGNWFFGPRPLPFGGVRVTTHQISLSIPIR
jgi:hypothetical protein